MNPTLYVSDLDGTLLGADHAVSQETSVTLKALIAQGADFVIATARNYASTSDLMAAIDYSAEMILSNGAMIVDAKGNLLWSSLMPWDMLSRIDSVLEMYRKHSVWTSLTDGNHLEVHFEASETVMCFMDYRRAAGFSAFRSFKAAEDLMDQEITTLTYMVSAGDGQACLALLNDSELSGEVFAHLMPYPGIEDLYTLTIQPKTTSKGNALKVLLAIRQKRGLSYDRVVAFGDQKNDLSLFASATEGYAVANAHPDLISKATGVIGPCDQSAVARWIAKDYLEARRIDEREIMFARMRYEPGSPEYNAYYLDHPDHLEVDLALREMPHIFGQGTATFHPHLSPFGDAGFEVITVLKQGAQQTKGPQVGPIPVDAAAMSKQLCAFAKQLGCYDARIVDVDLEDLYSHKGREDYGKTITLSGSKGIVLVKEMKLTEINRAPQLEAGFEVVKAYLDLAAIGLWLAKYIEGLGYTAKAHIDGYYDAFLPAIAQKANLGEIGRANLLIHPDLGMRLRLAMVTTDLPLETTDHQSSESLTSSPWQIKRFCEYCRRCATTCPGKAISKEDLSFLNKPRVAGWQFDQALCYGVWRRLGTDCGVCLSSCPFSQGLNAQEQLLMDQGNPEAAYLAYQERQPLRVYERDPLHWMTYPKPPLEI